MQGAGKLYSQNAKLIEGPPPQYLLQLPLGAWIPQIYGFPCHLNLWRSCPLAGHVANFGDVRPPRCTRLIYAAVLDTLAPTSANDFLRWPCHAHLVLCPASSRHLRSAIEASAGPSARLTGAGLASPGCCRDPFFRQTCTERDSPSQVACASLYHAKPLRTGSFYWFSSSTCWQASRTFVIFWPLFGCQTPPNQTEPH